MIIAVIYPTFAVAKRKLEKNSGLYRIRTLDPRALHQYGRGQGFESYTSLNFFSGFFFRNCKSWVYNCDDHPSFKNITVKSL